MQSHPEIRVLRDVPGTQPPAAAAELIDERLVAARVPSAIE
jgi:hypothetical protein